DRGLNVGLVTNDQAHDLVDTASLRARGFQVGEVPGACFCCKFHDLTQVMDQLGADRQPDVILAEPVGSCTDLVATVIQPLARLHGQRFEVGPLAVLVKPEHGYKILRDGSGTAGFSPKAEYIFLKQIEEADVVAVNKIDKFAAHQREELIQLVTARFPDKRVLAISSLHGDGFERLVQALDRPRPRHGGGLQIDYDLYAAGEAELCWLNGRARLGPAPTAFAVDDVVLGVVAGLSRRADGRRGAEPAHVKALGTCPEGWAIANLVSSGQQAELSCPANVQTRSLDLIVNARVATDPDSLQAALRAELETAAQQLDAELEIAGLDCFRPARPQPTHRDGPER
ncbi:MAG: cobalamin biosynthesis protein P47K, partial [Planctomycetales bacterium]|nr:cobalamin biosynthesis protein P47K [Planctomycetales bacterium]